MATNVRRKTAPRKSRRRYNRGRRTTRRVPRPIFRVTPPQHQNFKLVYNRTQVMNNIATGTKVNHLMFIPNSVVDCATLAGNQQAYLRDQLFTMYQHARCIKWVMYVRVYGIYQQNPCNVVIGLAKDGVYDSDLSLMKMRKYSKSAILTDSRKRTLKLGMYCDQYFGQSKGTTYKSIDAIQSDTVDLGSALKNYVQICVEDLSGTLADGIPLCYVDVQVHQYVRFENPIDQVAS